MAKFEFKPATKTKAKLRLALEGPSGSGKTFTALMIAAGLGERIAVADTEHGSASKYADKVKFDVVEMDSFHPENFIAIIDSAATAGYDVLVLDSLSHAWMGKDGALQLVDEAVKRQRTANSYTAWGDVTPLQQKMVDAILSAPIHIIATMRSKMEYVQEKDDRGKTIVRKIGLQPVQRDSIEYEFDVVGELDMDNRLVIGKTRCSDLNGKSFLRAGQEIADILKAWLSDGAEPAPKPPAPPATITPEQRKAIIALAGGDKSPCLDRILKLTVDAFKIQKLLDLPAGDYDEFCKAVTMNRMAIEAESEDVRKVAEDSFLKFAQACGRDAAIAIIESVAGVRAVEHVEDGDLKRLIARFEQEAEARVKAAKKASK